MCITVRVIVSRHSDGTLKDLVLLCTQHHHDGGPNSTLDCMLELPIPERLGEQPLNRVFVHYDLIELECTTVQDEELDEDAGSDDATKADDQDNFEDLSLTPHHPHSQDGGMISKTKKIWKGVRGGFKMVKEGPKMVRNLVKLVKRRHWAI